jgi:hypothetical protein
MHDSNAITRKYKEVVCKTQVISGKKPDNDNKKG